MFGRVGRFHRNQDAQYLSDLPRFLAVPRTFCAKICEGKDVLLERGRIGGLQDAAGIRSNRITHGMAACGKMLRLVVQLCKHSQRIARQDVQAEDAETSATNDARSVVKDVRRVETSHIQECENEEDACKESWKACMAHK